VANALAAEGSNLHLAARGEADLEKAAGETRATFGVGVDVHPTDLSRPSNAEALARDCGGVDILVNNAGAIPPGTLDDIEDEAWREAWDLKVFGYINLSRRVYADMCRRRRGVIVNIIGLAGQLPDAGYIAGCSANASLMMFTRALGGDSVRHGVRIVGINPGMVATERMIRHLEAKAERTLQDKAKWREFVDDLPFGLAAEPKEVANVVTFMASDRASYVSGAIVTIDGGFSARPR
jgi:NAD(P)-dependent dehydrogenase (short-subunit alcohol dehydrogenase family)